MRTLYLMRHAKSDWHSVARSDFERPLNKRGVKDASRVGQWLHTQKIAPSLILSSPARRAQQTAEAVTEVMGLDEDRIQFDKNLYLADRVALLNVLYAIPESTDSVLLVAHNPGLDELVGWLAAEPPTLSDSGKLMTTAAIAIFELPVPWAKLKRNAASLRQLLRPKELA
jgi:phosphohistidine phosphatase